MSKKPRAYSISDDVFNAVRKRALEESTKKGKRVSESEIVEKTLRKAFVR